MNKNVKLQSAFILKHRSICFSTTSGLSYQNLGLFHTLHAAYTRITGFPIFVSEPLNSYWVPSTVKVLALVAQSCLTLCNPMNCSLPGSSVHGILKARILEWLPFSPPGDLPNPEIEPLSPVSSALQADSLPTEPPGKPFNGYT